MRLKFWRKIGVTVVRCMDCKLLMDSTAHGEIPKVTHTYYDLCERCLAKRRGFKGAFTPEELGVR